MILEELLQRGQIQGEDVVLRQRALFRHVSGAVIAVLVHRDRGAARGTQRAIRRETARQHPGLAQLARREAVRVGQRQQQCMRVSLPGVQFGAIRQGIGDQLVGYIDLLREPVQRVQPSPCPDRRGAIQPIRPLQHDAQVGQRAHCRDCRGLALEHRQLAVRRAQFVQRQRVIARQSAMERTGPLDQLFLGRRQRMGFRAKLLLDALAQSGHGRTQNLERFDPLADRPDRRLHRIQHRAEIARCLRGIGQRKMRHEIARRPCAGRSAALGIAARRQVLDQARVNVFHMQIPELSAREASDPSRIPIGVLPVSPRPLRNHGLDRDHHFSAIRPPTCDFGEFTVPR